MAIRLKNGKYACSYCEKEYPDPFKADGCRDNHDLIYVQLSRQDVMRLLQFIYTGETKLLSPTLVRDLQRYARIKNNAKEDSYLPEVSEGG